MKKNNPVGIRKIFLMGNPNVGKSVIFSRLTGVNVIVSNYAGTTVEFTKGYIKLGNETAEIIDVPGTYTLDPTSRAEEVAVKMLKEAISDNKGRNLVINVVDATNLERNLNLTLQLLKQDIPVIIDLNLWDETKHIGISIDKGKLEKILSVPVVPTCAISGEGIKELVTRLHEAKTGTYEDAEEERWYKVGNIIEQVQQITHRHHTLLERLGDASLRPLTGIPIALVLIYLMFKIIRFIGEGLIGYIFEPLFEKLWAPVMIRLSTALGSGGFIHDILIGKLVEGEIDFVESIGLLTTGLFVPIAMVLPYVFAFYLVLGFVEDSGYLPRLGVMVDNIMHRLGLHGLAIVPMMLGLGCNVPGALATRVLETRRERFISATLMAIAVPCMAQIAMIVGLIGKYGAKGLGLVFGTLFVVWIALGILLNSVLKGESPEIFVEIPPYRFPYIVVDPNYTSFQIAENVKKMVAEMRAGPEKLAEKMNTLIAGDLNVAREVTKELRVKYYLTILNKVDSPEIEVIMRGKLKERGIKAIGSVCYDPEIYRASLDGIPLGTCKAEEDVKKIIAHLEREVEASL